MLKTHYEVIRPTHDDHVRAHSVVSTDGPIGRGLSWSVTAARLVRLPRGGGKGPPEPAGRHASGGRSKRDQPTIRRLGAGVPALRQNSLDRSRLANQVAP